MKTRGRENGTREANELQVNDDFAESTSLNEEFLGFTTEEITKSSAEVGVIQKILKIVTRIFKTKRECPTEKKTVETEPARRYPKRNLARINYKEEEVPGDDDYIYCDDCLMEWEGDCPQHGPLHIVPDTEVTMNPKSRPDPKYAMKTIPSLLRIAPSQMEGAGLGVWTKEFLPQGLRFGPYGGAKVFSPCKRGYCWEIKKEKRVIHYVDAYNPSKSNWMRYVNCARTEEEQNLVAFQYKGEIYYRTTQEIVPGVELLVWYGDDYGKELGIDVPSYHNIASKDAKMEKSSPVVSSPKDKRSAISNDLQGPDRQDYNGNGMQVRLRMRSLKMMVGLPDKITSLFRSRKQSDDRNGNAVIQNQNKGGLLGIEPEVESGIDKVRETMPFYFVRNNDHLSTSYKSGAMVQELDKNGDTSTYNIHEGLKSLRAFRFIRNGEAKIVNKDKAKNTKHLNRNLFRMIKKQNKYEVHSFHCHECSRVFTTKDLIRKHMEMHFGGNELHCNVCNLDFSETEELKKHNDGIHRINSFDFSISVDCENEKDNAAGRRKTFAKSSQICSREDSEDSTLVEIQNNMHAKVGADMINTEEHEGIHSNRNRETGIENSQGKNLGTQACKKTFACHLCRNTYSWAKDLRAHMETHTSVNTCHICAKRFTHKDLLKEHIVCVHLGRRKFICEHCGRVFEQKLDLAHHMSVHDEINSNVEGQCRERSKESKKISAVETADLRTHMAVHTGERPHSCTICAKGFLQRSHLRSHMAVHTGERPYSCTICAKGFSQKSNLRTHMAVHTGERPYSCTICAKGFSQKSDLRSHMAVHTGERPHSCTICAKGFSQKSDLRSHMAVNTGERPHSCTICAKGFLQRSHLRSHMAVHTGERPHSCTICAKGFSQKSDLRSHMAVHTGERPHSCTICAKGFLQRSHLRSHMAVHTGERPHSCTICAKGFSQKSDLRSHMAVHTGERPHSCTICAKGFLQRSHLRSHMAVHTGERPHSCTICAKGFSQKSNLRSHMAVHTGERPHSCTICAKGFSQKSNLRSHMAIHTGERPHSCTICAKEFCRRGDLRTHMAVHTGERPHSCTICAKGFSQKSNLRKHMAVHTGERPHSCTICAKGFSQKSNLRKHMAVHTGERPHSCTICAKGFSQKSNLRSHMAVHTGERPHSCTICAKEFCRRGDLRTHMAVHTGERPHSCTICAKGFSHRGNLRRHMASHKDLKKFKCHDCSYISKHKSTLRSHIMRVHGNSVEE